MIKIKRLEKEHLKDINNIRNMYLEFIRQYKEHNNEDQEDWFYDTKDIYFVILESDRDQRVKGAVGLTNIDMYSRKAEISLITEGYIEDEYAQKGLDYILNYGFNYIGLYKIFVTIFEYDKKKTEFIKKNGWGYDGSIRDDIYFRGKWHKTIYYSLLYKEYKFNGGI